MFRTSTSARRQSGVTLIGLLFWAVLLSSVALVAMMPLITVQAMGGIYVLKSKRGAEKAAALPYDEREIIELWEAC